MKIMKSLKKVTALALAAVTAFTYSPISAKAADDTAFTIRLEKYQGSVSVTNASRRKQTLRKDMRLLNGYRVDTQLSSYAWVSLDSTKAAKLDQKSSVELRKSGRKLQLMVKSGKMFFNVTKKLDDDESMEIKSSTMVTGIRGTFGWTDEVQPGHTTVNILNGRVECVLENPTGGGTKKQIINSGESAEFISTGTGDNAQTKVIKTDIQKEDIPGSMMVEIVQDPNMVQTISDGTGGNLDLSNVTLEEANAKMEQEQQEMAALNQQVQNQVQKQEEETSGGGESEFVITVPATGSGVTPTPAPVDPGTGGGGGGYSGGGTSGGGGGNSGRQEQEQEPEPVYAKVWLLSPSSSITYSYSVEPVGSYPTATGSDNHPVDNLYSVQTGKPIKFKVTVNSMDSGNLQEVAPLFCASHGSGNNYVKDGVSLVDKNVVPSGSDSGASAIEYTFSYTVPTTLGSDDWVSVSWDEEQASLWKYYGTASSTYSDSGALSCKVTLAKASDVDAGSYTISGVKCLIDNLWFLPNEVSGGYQVLSGMGGSDGTQIKFKVSLEDGYSKKYRGHLVANSSYPSSDEASAEEFITLGSEVYNCSTQIPSVDATLTISDIEKVSYGVVSPITSAAGTTSDYSVNVYNKVATISESDRAKLNDQSSGAELIKMGDTEMLSEFSSLITEVEIKEELTPTTTASWFRSMSSLATISGLSNLSTARVTNMSGMFTGCDSLTSVDLSGFTTANCTDMNNMFAGCSELTSINLSSFNTAKVTRMNAMFSGCTTMGTVTFSSNFNTAKTTDMAYMFADCENLSSLDLSGFDTTRVTDMSGMFSGCKGITEIEFGTGFTAANVENMKEMFKDCESVPMLNLAYFNTESLTNIKNMFEGCSALATIFVSMTSSNAGFKIENVTSEFGTGVFTGCGALTGGQGTTIAQIRSSYAGQNPETLDIGVDYAVIDGGNDSPGLFTEKSI